MKLLFDENLSPRLTAHLAEIFPDCVHVHDVGLGESSDSEIWKFAAEHNLIIVSQDSDFHQRSFVRGAPPKVIWLRRGNCSTAEIATMLRERYLEIQHFAEDTDAAFLALR